MNVRRPICIIVLFLIIALPIIAESPSWVLGMYDYNVMELQRDIKSTIDEGYVPVGLELAEDGSVFVLYSFIPSIEVYNWRLHNFRSLEELEDEFSEYLRAGWLPMGFSVSRFGVYVIFIETDNQADGWGAAESQPAMLEITRTMEEYRGSGYQLMGMSEFEDTNWFLYVRTTPEISGRIQPGTYSSSGEDLLDEIDTRVTEGGIPWGLSSLGDRLVVNYLIQNPE